MAGSASSASDKPPLALPRLLFLLGFMGCGKTTVGRLLARRLAWTFLDLDDEIERRQGRSISQIFAEDGEPFFRQLEHDLLRQLLEGGAEPLPTVIALGGGTFARPENVELIRRHGGLTFWLACPLDELRRRCRDLSNRPLARDPATFAALFELRLPYYEKADFRVDAGRRDPEAVVEEILRCVAF